MKTPNTIPRSLLFASMAVIAATSALHATVVENTLPVPIPDFMSPAQLTKWRAETTAKTVAAEKAQASSSAKTDSAMGFYTGKPYLAESGSYAYKYRDYNPELNRWTTVDPSGFPDGANNRAYVAVPTSELDPDGCITLSGNIHPSPETATTTYNGHTFQVDAWTAINIPSTSFSNYNGWSFSNAGNLSGTVNLTTYDGELSNGALGAHIEISTSGFSGNNYDWIQRVNTTDPITGQPNPKFDNYPPGSSTANSDPFYAGGKTTGSNPTFYDFSKRSSTSYDYLIHNPTSSVTWAGTLYPVMVNTSAKTAAVYDGLQWGWTMKMLE